MQFVLFHEHFDVFLSHATAALSLHLIHGLHSFDLNLLQTVQRINYEILAQVSRYSETELLLVMFSLVKNFFNTPGWTSLPALFPLASSCSPKFRHILLPKTCRRITFVFFEES